MHFYDSSRIHNKPKYVVHIFSTAVFRYQINKNKNVNLELNYKLEKYCLFKQTHQNALGLNLA